MMVLPLDIVSRPCLDRLKGWAMFKEEEAAKVKKGIFRCCVFPVQGKDGKRAKQRILANAGVQGLSLIFLYLFRRLFYIGFYRLKHVYNNF